MKRMTHTERAIQIALTAEANGVALDPVRFIDLYDRARERDAWEVINADRCPPGCQKCAAEYLDRWPR